MRKKQNWCLLFLALTSCQATLPPPLPDGTSAVSTLIGRVPPEVKEIRIPLSGFDLAASTTPQDATGVFTMTLPTPPNSSLTRLSSLLQESGCDSTLSSAAQLTRVVLASRMIGLQASGTQLTLYGRAYPADAKQAVSLSGQLVYLYSDRSITLSGQSTCPAPTADLPPSLTWKVMLLKGWNRLRVTDTELLNVTGAATEDEWLPRSPS